MELEGLIRCQTALQDHAVPVEAVTTDRHAGIASFIREEWSDIHHYFDTWHIAKGEFFV